MFGFNSQRSQGKESDHIPDSESVSCVVELSQASQTSQVSQQVTRQGGEPVKLPQGMVSKWVELEQEWRTKDEVGNSDAEKAYAEAYENLVQNIGKHNLENSTIPEHAILTEAQLEILRKQRGVKKNQAQQNQSTQAQGDQQIQDSTQTQNEQKSSGEEEEKQTLNETNENKQQSS
eukprot:TRINITY_DN17851_c0_g2_i1.p1 TRINITY_DN17851_c0_g2~~TRINITY_DN17851_c0_g2_i1.p1  ORF type:complete len:194 (+),score=21.26 TRINITY_DN17851_c0_g2_i1:57-584(+)